MNIKKQQQVQLYFIAIIPPEPIRSEVLGWKRYFERMYGSKAALRSPPHITLHMPFKWREDKEERIEKALETVTAGQQGFDLKLSGFGAFKPRTIFIRVMKNELLHTLHDALKQHMKTGLNIFNADYQGRAFHPHMTVAFRDLKKDKFGEAWDKFKSEPFEAAFNVNDISLLKHNGKFWEVHRIFPFVNG